MPLVPAARVAPHFDPPAKGSGPAKAPAADPLFPESVRAGISERTQSRQAGFPPRPLLQPPSARLRAAARWQPHTKNTSSKVAPGRTALRQEILRTEPRRRPPARSQNETAPNHSATGQPLKGPQLYGSGRLTCGVV